MYENPEMCHSLRKLKVESVQPQMKMSDIMYVQNETFLNAITILNRCFQRKY